MKDAHEPVTIKTRDAVDDDGFPISRGGEVTVLCRVQPMNLESDQETDRFGTFERLRVFAPPGTVVSQESEVLIRGEWYRVDEPPFNQGLYRRPALARHQPSVTFIAQRGEG